MGTETAAPEQRLQTTRLISLTMITGVVALCVLAVVTLGMGEYPSPLLAGALFVLNLVAFATAELVGYRTPAVPATDPGRALRMGADALQATTLLRLAVTEAPAIVSLVLAFVQGSAWSCVIGGVWAVLSMAWHGYPSRRVLGKLERSLDREGGRSRLGEAAAGGRPLVSG